MKAGQPDDIRRWLWQPQLHLIDCESGKASYSCRCIKSGQQLKTMIMKTIKFIILTLLVSMVSFAMAQKTFKPGDVIEGKTIVSWAKDWDLKAFQQTKEIYKAGMSQGEFIKIIRSNFPSQAPKSLIDVFQPYYEYIYNFHARNLSEKQVQSMITGVETAELITELSTWKANNPDDALNIKKWNWRKIVEIAIALLTTIFPFL
jgi:hypothetical protein